LVTKDGKKVHLTISGYTFARANISQEHAIRKIITEAVTAQASAWDLTTLVNVIVSGEISRDLFKAVKIIYPTRRVEIIKSKVEPVAARISTA
jgi:small subunit ribosomal protein S3Ae